MTKIFLKIYSFQKPYKIEVFNSNGLKIIETTNPLNACLCLDSKYLFVKVSRNGISQTKYVDLIPCSFQKAFLEFDFNTLPQQTMQTFLLYDSTYGFFVPSANMVLLN